MLHDVKQNSPEWFELRHARITASKLECLLVKGKSKSGFGAGAITLMKELNCQRLGVKPVEYSSKEMEWGHQHEPAARTLYELETGHSVSETGFWTWDELDRAGGSPDALVGDDGMLEIKCPFTGKVHWDNLRCRTVPKEYVSQIQSNLLFTEREWCDFMSYHPEFDPKYQAMTVRMFRDEELIEKIGQRIKDFVELMDEELEALEASL